MLLSFTNIKFPVYSGSDVALYWGASGKIPQLTQLPSYGAFLRRQKRLGFAPHPEGCETGPIRQDTAKHCETALLINSIFRMPRGWPIRKQIRGAQAGPRHRHAALFLALRFFHFCTRTQLLREKFIVVRIARKSRNYSIVGTCVIQSPPANPAARMRNSQLT